MSNDMRSQVTSATRICLVTGRIGACSHVECSSGKTIAQVQPAKAYSEGGLMASFLSKHEHNKFRQSTLGFKNRKTAG